MASALIIQPDETDPPERLGEWLTGYGIALHVIRPYAGERVPETLTEDALIVLGGDMGAHDERDHPWLRDIKALLRDAVEEETPTLGICLGGQLLAAATGGRVERGPAGMESGTVVVQARDEAAHDELFGGLRGPLRMMTMHRDAILELPSGAVWLAESDPYPHQAFRVGRAAWGVQFHPEISPSTYRSWAECSTDEGEALRTVVEAIPEVERFDDDIVVAAQAFTRSFARIVTSAGAPPRP